MGFKNVESSFPEVWEPKNPGDALTGYYVGSDEIPAPRKGEGKQTFTSYRLRDPETKKVMGISGAMLASKFNQVPYGALVKVTYKGMEKVNNGTAKLFDLQVDDSVTLLDPFAEDAKF